jgi:hypothetical protein
MSSNDRTQPMSGPFSVMESPDWGLVVVDAEESVAAVRREAERFDAAVRNPLAAARAAALPAPAADEEGHAVGRLLSALNDTYEPEGVLIYLTRLADKAEALAGGPPLPAPAADDAPTTGWSDWTQPRTAEETAAMLAAGLEEAEEEIARLRAALEAAADAPRPADDEHRDELRRLSEAATPGPWGWLYYDGFLAIVNDTDETVLRVADDAAATPWLDVSSANADFIEAAVNHVRAALSGEAEKR